ncbi:MAG: hypothetical protein ACRDYY_00430 [Acidimicrobiales bacterium]
MPDGAGRDLTQLLDTLMPAPACVFGQSFDYVAWNQSFATIWHPETLPVGRRNVIWMAFGEPERRRTWVNWEQRSQTLLAEFRAAAGRHAGSQRFAELIEALREASDEFASWWASYEVRQSITGDLKVRLPGQGAIAFHVVELRVCGHPSLTCSVHVPVRPSDKRKVAAIVTPRQRQRVA